MVESGMVGEEVVDPKNVLLGDRIVGVEATTLRQDGPGALEARGLPTPKGMTLKQREIHDLTHLPYEPSCEICVSCRRPNHHHRKSQESERTVPLVVGDYAQIRETIDQDLLNILVIRVYPYKLISSFAIPAEGT